MYRTFLKSKIRDVRISGLNLDYEGSITIDEEYLELADIAAGEQVHVLNVNNGARIITYVIGGPRGSGIMELNGPAARNGGVVGDKIMVLSYAMLAPDEIAAHTPTVISIGEKQRKA